MEGPVRNRTYKRWTLPYFPFSGHQLQVARANRLLWGVVAVVVLCIGAMLVRGEAGGVVPKADAPFETGEQLLGLAEIPEVSSPRHNHKDEYQRHRHSPAHPVTVYEEPYARECPARVPCVLLLPPLPEKGNTLQDASIHGSMDVSDGRDVKRTETASEDHSERRQMTLVETHHVSNPFATHGRELGYCFYGCQTCNCACANYCGCCSRCCHSHHPHAPHTHTPHTHYPPPPPPPPTLPPPPSPEPFPPPTPPPDISISPSSIYERTVTVISVTGTAAGEGHRLVFLAAGSADCIGATQKQISQGSQVASGSVTVELSTAAVYKLSTRRLPRLHWTRTLRTSHRFYWSS